MNWSQLWQILLLPKPLSAPGASVTRCCLLLLNYQNLNQECAEWMNEWMLINWCLHKLPELRHVLFAHITNTMIRPERLPLSPQRDLSKASNTKIQHDVLNSTTTNLRPPHWRWRHQFLYPFSFLQRSDLTTCLCSLLLYINEGNNILSVKLAVDKESVAGSLSRVWGGRRNYTNTVLSL